MKKIGKRVIKRGGKEMLKMAGVSDSAADVATETLKHEIKRTTDTVNKVQKKLTKKLSE